MAWDGSDWWSFVVIAGTFIAGLVCLCIGAFFIYYFFVKPFLERAHSRPASGMRGAPPPPHQYYYTPGQGVQQGAYGNNGVPVPSDPAKYQQYAQQQQYGVNASLPTGAMAPAAAQTPVFAQTPGGAGAQSQRGSWQQQQQQTPQQQQAALPPQPQYDAQSRHTPVSMQAYEAPPVYSHQYQLPPDTAGSQGALNMSTSAYNSGPQTQQYHAEEVDPATGAAVRTTYRTTTTVQRNTAVATFGTGSAV